jgi:hypothetical protein
MTDAVVIADTKIMQVIVNKPSLTNHRHCEERSDEAIHFWTTGTNVPHFQFSIFNFHCEERSDEAIHFWTTGTNAPHFQFSIFNFQLDYVNRHCRFLQSGRLLSVKKKPCRVKVYEFDDSECAKFIYLCARVYEQNKMKYSMDLW